MASMAANICASDGNSETSNLSPAKSRRSKVNSQNWSLTEKSFSLPLRTSVPAAFVRDSRRRRRSVDACQASCELVFAMVITEVLQLTYSTKT